MQVRGERLTLVDTTVWVDYIHGRETLQTDWLERNLARCEIGLTDLILCEVLQGLREADAAEFLAELGPYRIPHSVDQVVAVKSAEFYRYLRDRGITIRKTIDCLIATFCIDRGFQLLHNDRDFDPFEKYLGLNVVHPKPE